MNTTGRLFSADGAPLTEWLRVTLRSAEPWQVVVHAPHLQLGQFMFGGRLWIELAEGRRRMVKFSRVMDSSAACAMTPMLFVGCAEDSRTTDQNAPPRRNGSSVDDG